MLTLIFFFKTLIDLYIMILLLHAWMEWICCDLHNAFSQFIIKITKPVVKTIDYITSKNKFRNFFSLFAAFFLAVIKLPLLTLFEIHCLILNPIYLFVGILELLKETGKLIFWMMITRSLFNWISRRKKHPMDIVLYQLSEPFVYPIRRVLPVINGIDFSSLIVLFILYILNNIFANLFPGIWNRL
ncbi:YggT family protein [Sodalis sp. CWE]|uniref:YggT family protein n=1 Tax=Sodalis sp. CWE TaxID=2803816 RepID=UPI001C7DA587|nr:YggT family protein [Sodalis sp. CWE]MBX4180899.1 YggT family protein [Sodalis sp. CWE]